MGCFGTFITMEPNEDIYKINCLFELYKILNSITSKYLKCRVRSRYLAQGYAELFNGSLESACTCLVKGAIKQVEDTFARYLVVDIKKQDMIINKLNKQNEVNLERIKRKNQRLKENSREKFNYTYTRCERPVVGVYNEELHTIEIINYDQMYKNGEESRTQVKLEKITKNSPVLMAMLVTGPLLGFLGYLLYRENKIARLMNTTVDIPQDDDTAVKHILGNNNGDIIASEQMEKVDDQVQDLAKNTLNKLSSITNKNIVRMQMDKVE